jgi:hypothetical protein
MTEELLMTVATGGNDPMVDLVVTWAEFELGARREGPLKLNVGHIDRTGQLSSLWKKGNKFPSQPCSLDLIDFLLSMAATRGGSPYVPDSADYNPNAPVFHFRDSMATNHHRLTGRRFDRLPERIQLALPWANSISYSGHALRHAIGTII